MSQQEPDVKARARPSEKTDLEQRQTEAAKARPDTASQRGRDEELSEHTRWAAQRYGKVLDRLKDA